MIENGSVLTLEDNVDYAVVDTYEDNGIKYIFLVNMDDNTKFIYGKIENEGIRELTDPDELEKVIKQVYEHTHHSLKEDQ